MTELQVHPLVRVVANAISDEIVRDLSGVDPTGGHGYFAPGIVGAVTALRWLAQAGDPWNSETLTELANRIEREEVV